LVAGALQDKRPPVRDAALRALAGWPDPAPADEVLELAKATPDLVHHVLCLRGYVRMAGQVAAKDKAKALRMCEAALTVVRRDEERNLLTALRRKITGAK